jgi:hypothetical protein
MSSNTFFNNYLKIGADFTGASLIPDEGFLLQLKKRIDRWKVKFKNRTIDIGLFN